MTLSFGRPRRRRLPMMLQTEGAECGLACLAMVAARARLRQPTWPTLRQRFSVSMKGATMADLVRMAGQLHLQPAGRARRDGAPAAARAAVRPALGPEPLRRAEGDVRRGGAVIHDPARGVRRLPLAEVSRHFTGVALELHAGGRLPAAASNGRRVGLRQLLGRVSGLKRSLAQIFVLALALEAFVLLTPFYLQWVVDGVLVSADRDLLVTLGIGFGLLVLIQVGAGGDPLLGGAAPVGDPQPAVAGERLRAPDAAAGRAGSSGATPAT